MHEGVLARRKASDGTNGAPMFAAVLREEHIRVAQKTVAKTMGAKDRRY
jgi:hypothetical protein